jgi:hypothetical protein
MLAMTGRKGCKAAILAQMVAENADRFYCQMFAFLVNNPNEKLFLAHLLNFHISSPLECRDPSFFLLWKRGKGGHKI